MRCAILWTAMETETDAHRASEGRIAPWFWIVVLLALAIRIIYLLQLSQNPIFDSPILDEKIHHEWASLSAAGEDWSVDPGTGEAIAYFRAPLYIWFLAGVYKIFGIDPGFAPRLIQSLVGALGCGLLLLLGARLFNRTVGILAGLAAALNWILVFFDNELLIVPLIVFLDIAFVLLLVIAAEKRRWPLWAAAGLLMGLSAIARPNILLFAPPLCVWILLLARRSSGARRTYAGWKGGVGHACAFGLALLVPILPITARNLVVGDDTVLIASQGGVNFYIGNNPDTDGVTAVVPGTSNNWWEAYFATHAMAERALGHKPKPSEVSRFFFDKGLQFWIDDPKLAAYSLMMKLRYFFCRQEYANNKCIYTFTEEFTPVTAWLPLGFWIVAPLGLLGLFISLFARGSVAPGRGGEAPGMLRLFPLWGFILFYTLSVVIFFITARFRVPVVPFLIIYAAFGIQWFARKIAERAYRAVAGAGVALAALICFVLYVPGPGFCRTYKVTEDFFCTVATELHAQGEWEKTIEYADKTLKAARISLNSEETPAPYRFHLRLVMASALRLKALALLKLNRPTEALDALRQALGHCDPLSPQAADLHLHIAAILKAQGLEREALQHRNEAARIRRRLNSSR